MVDFKVTTGKLTNEAAGLRSLKQQLENEIQQMRSISTRYLSMWEGQAKQAFVNEVNKHMNLLQAFTRNMENFAKALESSATTYENGERKAVGIASDK